MKLTLLIKWLLLLSLLCQLSACVSTRVSDVKPGYKPVEENTDEAGMWFQMDKAEKIIAASAERVNDPLLQSYIEELSCKLAADICKDMRIYVVRDASFNASMAPNGMMLVHTGLLLRSQNEAQLATVLGHEIGHYRKRHSLENWRKAKNMGNFLNGVGMVAGGTVVGAVALIGAIASFTAFSRDQEREADRLGFESLRAAGMDVQAPAALWSFVHEETKHYPKGLFSQMFATHPADTERQQYLKQMADQYLASNPAAGEQGQARYLTHTKPWLLTWISDELALRAYTQTEVLLKRLSADPAYPRALMHYALGELYRKRGQTDDLQLALKAYQQACGTKANSDAIPECFRDLGLSLKKLNRTQEAKSAFAEYLKRAPAAEDAAMIRSYLQ